MPGGARALCAVVRALRLGHSESGHRFPRRSCPMQESGPRVIQTEWNQTPSTRGPVNQFDPRLTPARADLAAKHLEGRIAAERFVAGEAREIAEAQAPVRRIPSPEAPLDTEALEGERVTVYEISEEGWAWGQLAGDGYVGYLSANALRPVGPAMTHKVVAARTLVFPGPSIKLPPSGGLPLGALLSVARIVEPFAVTTTGAFVPPAASCAHRRGRERPCRGRRAFPARALSLGRQDVVRPRLLGAGAGGAERLRHLLPARQRHAGESAGRCPRLARSRQATAWRPDVLEGPRRDRPRPRHAHPRQRLPHGGDDRADRRRRGADRREWLPADQHPAADRRHAFSTRRLRSTTCSSGRPRSCRSICRTIFATSACGSEAAAQCGVTVTCG